MQTHENENAYHALSIDISYINIKTDLTLIINVSNALKNTHKHKGITDGIKDHSDEQKAKVTTDTNSINVRLRQNIANNVNRQIS